jgi:hypothetical protein
MGWVMLVYFIGLFSSIFLHVARAGLYKVNASRGEFVLSNVGWHLMLVGKSFAWPVVLIVWLVRGMPASRWQAMTEIDGRPARAIIRK